MEVGITYICFIVKVERVDFVRNNGKTTQKL